MLADEDKHLLHVGELEGTILLPGEWLSSLIEFIYGELPDWRDDPQRSVQTGETRLTAQLCAYLNGRTRHTQGWDFLQFKREEPDETDARRSIDLTAAPCGTVVRLEGIEYSEYRTLLPIECKRLPTPPGSERDEREYLHSKFKTTGGVQRFKAGHHAAAHTRAAMIGYVQSDDITYWEKQLDQWVEALVSEAKAGWSASDKLATGTRDAAKRVALLCSKHIREKKLEPITLDHIWIEMS